MSFLELIRQVIPQPEDELYRLLASLQHKEFLYEQPAFPEVEYIFKHALTQEVAYNSVLQERRKALHEQTAQAMEELYPATAGRALQCAGASLQSQWQHPEGDRISPLAGQQAVQRSANTEAISHLTAALELLKTLPDTPERAHKNSRCNSPWARPLMATKGFAAPEVKEPTPVRVNSASSSAKPLSSSPYCGDCGCFIKRGEFGRPASWRSNPHSRPARTRPSPPGGLHALGEDLVLAWESLSLPESTWSKELPSTTLSSTALWLSSMVGMTLGCLLCFAA